ncbi:hypothetical protein H8959_011685, partial [Pygathrix nigripes]
ALWPSVSSPVSQGASTSHGSLLGQTLQNPKPTKTDGCQSGHHAYPVAPALVITMAAGKGVPLSPSAENRWRLSEPELGRGCKPVLLEKTNRLGPEAAVGRAGRDVGSVELALLAAPGKPRPGKPLPLKARGEQRQSAFTEAAEDEGPAGQPGTLQLTQDVPRGPASSKVFSVWPSRARGEQRSAFSKPTKRPAERPGPTSVFPAGECADTLGELSGLLNTADLTCWGRLSTPKLLVGDFWNLQALPQNAPLCSTFLGAPTLWLEHTQAQVPPPASSSTTSWALLPPTLTSLGLSTQNWCAKCNLSFRLTSDLVFHMRSHHKKEHAGPDTHSQKQREEALACPVCQEHFRERHHLSRHMTSHS